MSSWVVFVGDLAVVGFGEGAAGEDMGRCETRGFRYAVEEKDLVRRGDEQDAVRVGILILVDIVIIAYLELGRGTCGVFNVCFDGLWSAGEDILRFWKPVLES